MIAIRRNENRDRPAHNLCGCITIDSFRPFVPSENYAVQVLADDGIVGTLPDRTEQHGLLLGLSRFVDVAASPDTVGLVAILAFQWSEIQFRPELRAVLADHQLFRMFGTNLR